MNNNKNALGRHHPSLGDRQAAERKLCRLFESFGVDAMMARDRLIDPFMERGAAFWRSHAGLDFAALAVEEAEADLEAWFASLLGGREHGQGSQVMTGRAAFLMCGGQARWTDVLLAPLESLPRDFVDSLRQHAPIAVPLQEMGEMEHQPYEAWSVQKMLAKALPVDQSIWQGFSGLIRRDSGRILGFGWRDTGPTS